ncbi:hypothetical protein C5Y96_01685 [Blastopirellula marina]|uniref:DUF1598 domain-containing protein n=1 Tax=Blastopirellula marina TaxID=124 RepID=A0A2S8G796_9BACT|nr:MULTISPECIES: DUF1598 domain-containing protein [Pirellulaceae]PQO40309.1 hypothetical protein C5Y96_01685 [Blastopirellula marina]RCS55857.1 DUF1598 domain-containing protein [Bremerella cremea]
MASLILALSMHASFSQAVYGQEVSNSKVALDKVQSFSRVGEFTRAFQEIANVEDAALRDEGHSSIARMQMKAGLIQAAVETASYIEDDVNRSELLSEAQTARSKAPVARGGGVTPDFDQLIDLITTTVEPESWEELGGPGSIAPFPTGVYVDSQGTLKRITQLSNDSLLSDIHDTSKILSANNDAAAESVLRKVSLTRLEKEAQLRWAIGRDPSDTMLNMAGIYEVKYLLVYPETGEIVIAGPAGPWHANAEGRHVNIATGRPVLQLDDLVVLLRNAIDEHGKFGCAITPTQQGLKSAQEYIDVTSAKPLHPRQRDQWLKGLQAAVGKQDITVHGVNPDTRVGQIIVEADYHMKRIGMGLEDGTAGVPSYLEMVTIPPGGSPPPMDVLRWWFTLDYRNISVTKERDAFALQGPGVKVLSENEHLDAQGQRIHTNTSTALNATFARNFSTNYASLAVKYPIYAELKNVFDLAMITSLIEKERLADQVGWNLTHFGPDGGYQVATGSAPKVVDSIMNMRIIDKKHIIAGVSGGVNFDPSEMLTDEKMSVDEYGLMTADHKSGNVPQTIKHHGWWWD